jgi:hypothetical protein
VGSVVVVVVDPVGDHDPGFLRGDEKFLVEQLVTELVVPGLDVGVLPPRGRGDECAADVESRRTPINRLIVTGH